MRPRLLIASQPEAWLVVSPMLAAVADLVPVHTAAQALQVLERDPDACSLIVCTVAFDDSQMLQFLQAVKDTPALKPIPFLCCRILASVLSDNVIGLVRTVCVDCGAVDLLDISNLAASDAQTALQGAVMLYAARPASSA
jgi:hypothetical protein